MISKENQIMLDLLGDSLHGRESEPIEEQYWQTIIEEMLIQTVFAVPVDYINLEKIEHSEKIKYMQLIGKNLQKYHTLMSEQQILLNILDNAGIVSVILKGSSSAMNYPSPVNRCMGDIDIIV